MLCCTNLYTVRWAPLTFSWCSPSPWQRAICTVNSPELRLPRLLRSRKFRGSPSPMEIAFGHGSLHSHNHSLDLCVCWHLTHRTLEYKIVTFDFPLVVVVPWSHSGQKMDSNRRNGGCRTLNSVFTSKICNKLSSFCACQLSKRCSSLSLYNLPL